MLDNDIPPWEVRLQTRRVVNMGFEVTARLPGIVVTLDKSSVCSTEFDCTVTLVPIVVSLLRSTKGTAVFWIVR